MVDRGASEPGDQVDGERDRGEVEADGIVVEVGEREPDPGDQHAEQHRQDEACADPGGDQLRGRGGCDQQREHEQRAGDLRRRRDGQPEREHERERDAADRDAAGARDWLVDRGEQQRPADDREEPQCQDADDREREHLPAGDSEEVAEQQVLIAGEDALVEAEEQEPARQPERLDRAGHGGLLAAVPSRAGGAHADHQRAGAAEGVVADGGGQPEQQRERRAGERHHRQRVPGERLAAQHHEPADHAGHDRDDRPGLERVDHERVGGQLPEIRDQIDRQRGERQVANHDRAGGGRCDARAPRAGRPRRAVRRRPAAPRSARRRGGSTSRR